MLDETSGEPDPESQEAIYIGTPENEFLLKDGETGGQTHDTADGKPAAQTSHDTDNDELALVLSDGTTNDELALFLSDEERRFATGDGIA
jgi:hypothetical protein